MRRLLILASEDIGRRTPEPSCRRRRHPRPWPGWACRKGGIIWPRPPCIWPWPPRATPPRLISGAQAALEDQGATRVPPPLQDAHRDKKGLGHGQGYLYPHDFPGHWVDQSYLPAELDGANFYEPGTEGEEPELAALLAEVKK